jgi:hypothetical protein
VTGAVLNDQKWKKGEATRKAHAARARESCSRATSRKTSTHTTKSSSTPLSHIQARPVSPPSGKPHRIGRKRSAGCERGRGLGSIGTGMFWPSPMFWLTTGKGGV